MYVVLMFVMLALGTKVSGGIFKGGGGNLPWPLGPRCWHHAQFCLPKHKMLCVILQKGFL